MDHSPRSIERIIERQVRHWEIQRGAASTKDSTAEPWPVITISREFGARGAALGRLVGERTGFSVWDRELVQTIAKETGSYQAVFDSLAQTSRNAIEQAISAALAGSGYTQADYVRVLMRAIHGIAAHGGAIIVGRGGNFVLDSRRALRVRVVCAKELRVHAYAEREAIPEKQARKHVESMDAERAEFVRHHFHRDVADPTQYDLLLNAGTLTEPTMADILLLAYERTFSRQPPRVQSGG